MRILIAAHDAGGAEIISSWVKTNPQHYYFYILQGPAIKIFTKKINEIKIHSFQEIAEIITNVSFVLTGTSWGSNLEKKVIKIALEKKIFVAAYLDHWVNYRERFLQKNALILPNEIWVGDKIALDLAKSIFKKTPIRLVQNQYFKEVKKEFDSLPAFSKSSKYHFLYICEPVEAISHWKTGKKNVCRYTEFSALEFFFDTIFKLQLNAKISFIRLRLHPSELKDKYDFFIKKIQMRYACEIAVSNEASLLTDFAWADVIVGVSSMALVVAQLLNKKTFTCIPENADVTNLPFDTIFKLEDFDLYVR